MIVCVFSLDFVTEVAKPPEAKEERGRQCMGMAGERSLSLTFLIPHNFMCQQLISHSLTSSRDGEKRCPEGPITSHRRKSTLPPRARADFADK